MTYGVFWKGGRVVEGAPLLREYPVYSRIEGSNPSLSATFVGSAFAVRFGNNRLLAKANIGQ